MLRLAARNGHVKVRSQSDGVTVQGFAPLSVCVRHARQRREVTPVETTECLFK
ncbi:MAG: hypothetical protein LBD80_07875 [Tannerella sp.]|nr:hypothetical protein [Tannerella sp.]